MTRYFWFGTVRIRGSHNFVLLLCKYTLFRTKMEPSFSKSALTI